MPNNTEKLIDLTDLKYYHDQVAENAFAGKDLEDTVAGIVAEGGEPNVIEAVKVNGTALVPENKAVNIDLSAYALSGDVPTTVAQLSDAGDYATTDYVDANGGKIDVIKVNGAAQAITNKSVDITVPAVPTNVSDFTNDAGYQTAGDVSSAIGQAVASVYRYKGSVATKTALPSDAAEGDVYDVQSTGMNYAWNGSKWDELGIEFDGSLFWDKETYTIATTADIAGLFAE